MTASHPFVVELRDVSHGAALRGVSVGFTSEALHFVRAPSAGEAETLLRVAGLLEKPERGEVILHGRATGALDDVARAEMRNHACGYVFTAPFLLGEFTMIENVAMPLFKIAQVGPEEARARTVAALEFVGLGEMMEVPASALPAEEARRVALARALIHEPKLLLVEQIDATPHGIFAGLVRRACERYGVAAIATVSPAFVGAEGDRVIDLVGGLIRSDSEAVPGS